MFGPSRILKSASRGFHIMLKPQLIVARGAFINRGVLIITLFYCDTLGIKTSPFDLIRPVEVFLPKKKVIQGVATPPPKTN